MRDESEGKKELGSDFGEALIRFDSIQFDLPWIPYDPALSIGSPDNM